MAAALFLTPSSSTAQIANVQSLIAKETPGWTTQIEASFDFRSWNKQQAMIGGGVVVRYVNGDNVVLAVAKGDAISRAGEPWQERHLQHLRFRHHFQPTIFDFETFVQHSTDVFRRLDNRFLVGAGPRLRLVTTPLINVALGSLPMFEFERLSEGKTFDSGLTRSRARLSNYAIFTVKAWDKVTVQQSIYLQPRLDDWADTRLLNEFEFTVNVTQRFAFRWMLAALSDPRAPVGIVPVDTTVKSSALATF